MDSVNTEELGYSHGITRLRVSVSLLTVSLYSGSRGTHTVSLDPVSVCRC